MSQNALKIPEGATREKKLPPMLVQYLEYKEQYPDCLLLFQVGDFYEAFFDDARLIAQTLNLTLTSRDKNSENPVPMSGVPIAVVDNYIQRLVDENIAVALVSQKGEAGKGMVARELERIITPGVQILGGADASDDAVICSLYFEYPVKNISLAFSYPASGEIQVLENLSQEDLLIKFAGIMPRELILPRSIDEKKIDRRLALLREVQRLSPDLSVSFRSTDTAISRIKRREFVQIPGYSEISTNARAACRLLLNYLDEVTVEKALEISAIRTDTGEKSVLIDASTRSNLELVTNQKTGTKAGSLYAYLDFTATSGGGRLLKKWILSPSADQTEINLRLDAVEDLVQHESLNMELGVFLSAIADMERIAARIELDVVSPGELGALRDSLLQTKQITGLLSGDFRGYLKYFQKNFVCPEEALTLLIDALDEYPPTSLKDMGVFRKGYNQELDSYINLRENGKTLLKDLETRERGATGITSLKVKFNNVHNYFFEVTKANLDKVPEYYLKKQSTVNYERFYTPELKKLEEDLLSAEFKQLSLEKKLFEGLKQQLKNYVREFRLAYREIARLDVLSGFANLSRSERLVRPEMTENEVLIIEEGRHPVLAKILMEDFVPNSIVLKADSKSCIILTGPNMGGKSTYLRQTALIVIMAQVGCFIPAKSAVIGLADRVFARIGASDDQAEGDSTFMVEMREASGIISAATKKSLILIDELGRGTSTTDGLALAQAVLEWLVVHQSPRTLFATHFHSLTKLAETYPRVKNFSVGSVDIEGQVIFTHEICEGAANNSYGLEVARLAGLPEELLDRAFDLVSQDAPVSAQLPLFVAKKQEPNPYREAINKINPDELSPKEALDFIYRLKEIE